ncbi:MAG: DUF3630 family protein [Acidobacteria bacterium]|nr:DUF3630 family protein [Acidobacteriota bacterium]
MQNPFDIPVPPPLPASPFDQPAFDAALPMPINLWLQQGLRGADAERLFEHIRLHRDGTQERSLLSDGMRRPPDGNPDWTVRMEGAWAIVHYSPAIMEPCMLTIDELVSLVLRWFDAQAPGVAQRLRSILAAPPAPPRVKNTATLILAAALGMNDLSEAAVAKALGIPLELEKTSEPMRYYIGRFAEGPFETADFRWNTERRSGDLFLKARTFRLDDVDFDALGEWPAFSGFDLMRPEEPGATYAIDFGGKLLRYREPKSGRDPSTLAIEWKRSAYAPAMQACGEPPAKIPQLTAAHGFRTPGRYWLEMTFASGAWMPSPPLAVLPHHAARVELANIREFPSLAMHQNDRVRFTVQVLARDVRQAGENGQWRDTLLARIHDVCVAAKGQAEKRAFRMRDVVLAAGERGAVVDVLHAAGEPDKYIVESVDENGATAWIAEYGAEQLSLESPRPSEVLQFEEMASGERSLLLTREVPAGEFPRYAAKIAERIGGAIVDRAEDPSERVWTVDRDGLRFWITHEDYGPGPEVALEPQSAAAGATMDEIRRKLIATQTPREIVFRLARDEQGRLMLASGCYELDYFLNYDLGGGGDVNDRDSLTQEIFGQIRDFRMGRCADVRNGGDGVCVRLDARGARLELAVPGAARPGPLLDEDEFVSVMLRWFDAVNPDLAVRLRSILREANG